jgi:hypothetical protein
MTAYHAVMKDETGREFGVTIDAMDKPSALRILTENYPESQCVQLEDDNDTREREEAMYRRVATEDDGYYEDEMDCY